MSSALNNSYNVPCKNSVTCHFITFSHSKDKFLPKVIVIMKKVLNDGQG